MMLFEYTKNTAFGRVLPKTKIYEHGKPSAATKSLFVKHVEQIKWQYKLAPETINIKSTKAVPEIQVFTLALKEPTLKTDVLRCIDQAIAYPIIFELTFNNKVKAIAAYKRPNEADASKWVLGSYLESDWLPATTPRNPLPPALDLEALYAQLLKPLIALKALPKESLQQQMARLEQIRSKQRELEKCEAKLNKEKQFNRKVELNAVCRKIQQEIAYLETEGAE